MDYKLHARVLGCDIPAIVGGRGGHGTTVGRIPRWAKRLFRFVEVTQSIKLWVRTEDGTATFGYLANSSGVGGGHVFDARSIDWVVAIGTTVLPEESMALLPHWLHEAALNTGTLHTEL